MAGCSSLGRRLKSCGSLGRRLKSCFFWTDLPEELWDAILSKLMDHRDYVRFGAVCKLFQSVALYQKPERQATIRTQEPPLMILVKTKGKIGEAHSSGSGGKFQLAKLYDPKENKVHNYEFKVPVTCKDCYLCSSHGWLIYISNPGNPMELFNPFSGKSIEIPGNRPPRFKKVILSCDPTASPNDFVIGAMCHVTHGEGQALGLGLKKADQTSWLFYRERIHDIIFHNGLLYAVDEYDRLLAFDYKSDNEFVPKFIVPPLVGIETDIPYLVEASNGDLLLACASIFGWKFRMFKLVEKETRDSSQVFNWVEIFKLENNDSIFCTNYYCCGTSTSCIPKFKDDQNCIYFTHSFDDGKALCRDVKHSEIGVFRLNDGALTTSSEFHADKDYPFPLIWINPTLC